MKSILVVALVCLTSTVFAKEEAVAVATLRGASMQEVEAKVEQFLADLKTDKYLKELLPRECNPTSTRRVTRRAYAVSFSSNSNSYRLDSNGDLVQASPSAQIKVACTSYSKDDRNRQDDSESDGPGTSDPDSDDNF